MGLMIDYIVSSVENSLSGFPLRDFHTRTLLASDAPARRWVVCITIP